MSSDLKNPDRNKPRRGRPPVLSEEVRRQRLLEAAEQVFSDIGYSQATMEEIARRARMSKKTLYALFPDKRALFTALISTMDAYPDDASEADLANSHRELREKLLRLAELALSKRYLSMARLVISEARRCPELAEDFHDRSMEKGRAYLVAALRTFAEANPRLLIPDIEGTAIALFSVILGDLHFRALLGEKPVSGQRLEFRVDRAMKLILPEMPEH